MGQLRSDSLHSKAKDPSIPCMPHNSPRPRQVCVHTHAHSHAHLHAFVCTSLVTRPHSPTPALTTNTVQAPEQPVQRLLFKVTGTRGHLSAKAGDQKDPACRCGRRWAAEALCQEERQINQHLEPLPAPPPPPRAIATRRAKDPSLPSCRLPSVGVEALVS